MERLTAPSRFQIWIRLWTVYIVWGSTYLGIALMVKTMPPLLSAGVRYGLAGAILIGWVRWRRGPQRITLPELGSAALVGTLLVAGGNGLVTVAEQEVPSGLAGLIMAATPLWVVVWRALAHDRATGGTLVGVAVGFLGVAVLMLPGDRPGDVAIGWVLLVVCASLLWSLGTFGSSRLSLPPDLLHSTGLQMASGGVVMIVVGLAIGEGADFDPASFSTESILGFVYLVFIGSIVAFTAYVWLLQHVPVSKVATYAYVNPVVAVTLGAVWLDEEITTNTLLGAVVIVASVAFVVRTESQPQEPAEPDAVAAKLEATPGNGRGSPAGSEPAEGARLRR